MKRHTEFTGLGCLNTQVTLYYPTYSVQSDGSRAVSWAQSKIVWAQVVPTGSAETLVNGVPALTARYLIRILPDDAVMASWKVVLPSGEAVQIDDVRTWGPCTELAGFAVPAQKSA